MLGLQIDDGQRFDEPAATRSRCRSAPAIVVLLFTDGVTEAMNDGGRTVRRRTARGARRGARRSAVRRAARAHPARDRDLCRRHGPAGRHDVRAAEALPTGDRPRRPGCIALSPERALHVPVVVFTTTSDIEASVVLALLDSQGISSFRISGNPQAILPMSVEPARRGAHRRTRGAGRRGAAHHREPSRGRRRARRAAARRVRRAAARIEYRFKDRGLLEHALTHKSRAAEDVSGGVADNESLEFLGDAVLGLVVAERAVPPVSDLRRRTEVEDQGVGRLDAVAGAPAPRRCSSAIT